MVKVIIPIFIVRFIISQKYWFSALFCCMQFVIYLYTGHKTWLFVIPLAVAVGFWTKRKHFYKEFLLCICFGVGILTILACIQPDNSFFQRMFSFLGRRAIIDPAYNKFAYFDYFSNHPLVGLGGMIPRWLIHIPNYYENISYPMEIGKIYFNEPDMYCNTGFLAEGFMRFGYIGTILILVLFAIILLQIDAFQKRVGFRMAVGFFIYPIYSLVDAHLIDSFILGPWMALEIILLFYTQTDWKDYELLLQKSKRIIKRTMGIFKKQ